MYDISSLRVNMPPYSLLYNFYGVKSVVKLTFPLYVKANALAAVQ